MLISRRRTRRFGATPAFTAAALAFIMMQGIAVRQAAAKVAHIDFRELVALSDCIALVEVTAVETKNKQEYAILHPIQQIKGALSEDARFHIGSGEGKFFTLKPGSIAIVCLKAEKAGKAQNLYCDTYAGRGTMPIYSATKAKVVAVETGTVQNVPAKKLERKQIGLRWEGWRNYFSFHDYPSFLAVLERIVAAGPAKKTLPRASKFGK